MTELDGSVTDFDEAVGLGRVAAEGGAVYDFHCTQIDGESRTIAVGTAVCFHVIAGHLGRWEAGGIRPA